MTALEQLVRPFEAFSGLPVPSAPKPSAETQDANVRLEIGRGANGKTFTGSFNGTVSRYMDSTVKEKKRETSEKRVENPDDPEQYVMVERVDKLKVNGVNGQKTNYEFKNPKT
jgi:hypothetical protein